MTARRGVRSFLELDDEGAMTLLRSTYGWQPSDEPVVAPLDGASPAALALRAGGESLRSPRLRPRPAPPSGSS